MNTLYLGRNIKQDDKGFYLTFSDTDLTSSHNIKVTRNHHSTYEKALHHMKYMKSNGSHWFDAHFDPTI